MRVEEVVGKWLVIVSPCVSLAAMCPTTLLYGQPVTTPFSQLAPAKDTALPWVELVARPWIVRMSGDVVAREAGAPSGSIAAMAVGLMTAVGG
jgi:hypothetical protein